MYIYRRHLGSEVLSSAPIGYIQCILFEIGMPRRESRRLVPEDPRQSGPLHNGIIGT